MKAGVGISFSLTSGRCCPYIRSSKYNANFTQNERWMEPADRHDTSNQFDPLVHSTHGINSVSLAGFPHPIDSRVIRTTEELSDEFPFNLDMNSGDHIGVGTTS
jgi:hypothetical protein